MNFFGNLAEEIKVLRGARVFRAEQWVGDLNGNTPHTHLLQSVEIQTHGLQRFRQQ